MTRRFASLVPLVLLLAPAPPAPTPRDVVLPNGEGGIGFDDLRWCHPLRSLLVPAGGTGMLHLLGGAANHLVTTTVRPPAPYKGGHDEGITSADHGRGLVFATDRTSRELVLVDVMAKRVFARSKLSAQPDYVRWVEPAAEVWVTEPDAEAIEVFRTEQGHLVRVASIPVPGGPESLVVDAARKRAYAHLWKGKTVAIDLKSRKLVASWKNGCEGSRGLALDEARGLLLSGCAEGKATAVDVASGKLRGSVETGAGVDLVDFSPTLRHLYVPGGSAATLTVVGVAADGRLTSLGSFPSPEGGHCVAVDGGGRIVVCDPKRGRLVLYADPFPAQK
jgi:hypothetical protein